MYKIKSGLRLITKEEKSKEKKTKYNRLELTSDPIPKGSLIEGEESQMISWLSTLHHNIFANLDLC